MPKVELTARQMRIVLEALTDFRDVRQDTLDEWPKYRSERVLASKRAVVQEMAVANRVIQRITKG